MKLVAFEVACRASQLEDKIDLFTSVLGFHLIEKQTNRAVLSQSASCVVLLGCEAEAELYRTEHVSNLIFQVKEVESLYSTIRKAVDVKEELAVCSCHSGSHHTFAVDSPFLHVKHTFTSCPKFAELCSEQNDSGPPWKKGLSKQLDGVDHITFACEAGHYKDYLLWYETVLGLKRFMLSPSETEDGFSIKCDTNGMKMAAVDYFRCAEVGVISSDPTNPVKLIFAEPIQGLGANQLTTFLTENGGPGIQHIALHSKNLLTTVELLKTQKLAFIEPPMEYYSEIGCLDGIEMTTQDKKRLKDLGILIDVEQADHSVQPRYLLQVFTEPLLETNTFFLEYIQRNGASGFGVGNIKALWKALQKHLAKDES